MRESMGIFMGASEMELLRDTGRELGLEFGREGDIVKVTSLV